MRLRTTFALALTATAVVAGSAGAAAPVKKECNLVVDPTGDVSNEYQGVEVFPADAGLDVVGGDVASNAKNITAVVRLANAPGSATIYAKRFIVQFTAVGAKNPVVLAAAISPTGTVYNWGFYGTTTTGTGYNYPGTATGSITDKTITISAPLADIGANENLGLIKSGAKISGITVTSFRRVPALTQVTGQVIEADAANGKRAYYAGKPSCVTVPA